ncbi:EAL domain-containing protein [Telluria mixta]|uniref:EAL domain-containing protein n=1 Tax=Telluria mixta TaxID=34071 RepID=A0ABT2BU98_9BURK|nr:EAL domain-containing protein [Telluria mixta]MCS0628698.1 EAL domain-containing protein [Telluria mixta]WEM97155.1 EAL domain-containing protein [Telluria mixta]
MTARQYERPTGRRSWSDSVTMDNGSASGAQPGAWNRQQLIEWQLAEVQSIGHVGTWEFHLDPAKLVWSAETCRIIGLSKNSIDGRIETFLSLVHPDDRDAVETAIRDNRQQPRPIQLEHRIVRPDGTVRHVRVHGVPYRDESGRLVLAGTVHDITEIRQSTEELQAMSRKLLETLEAMADAFYTLDEQWRFTYLNGAAERLLRRPRHELLGKVLWDAYPDLVGSHFGAQYELAMERRQPLAFEEYYAPLQAWKDVRIYPTEEGLATYTSDITERKRLEEIEHETTERFRMVAKVTSDIIWDWDVPNDRLWWNEGMQSVFGYSEDVLSDGIDDWVSRIAPEDRERIVSGLYAAMDEGRDTWSAEYRFRREDGSYATVRDQGVFMRNADGATVNVIGSMVDITAEKQVEAERRETEARNRLQASLLDKAHDSISVSGIDGRITYWNQGAERLFGWTAAEVIGKTKAELLMLGKEYLEHAHRQLLLKGEWHGEVAKRRKDGREVMVESHLTLVRDDDGQPQRVLEIDIDITQRKHDEHAILSLAFFDPLTRLPNRRLLLDRLRHAVAATKRDGHGGALLFIDLDNFKTLNDTLGHDKGDQLLQQVARRLEARVARDSDTVARHGGDEFVIVLEDLSPDREKAALQAELVAEKLLGAFNEPFQLDEHLHHTSPSIGVALFDKDMKDIDELLKRADLAMYQAKAAGRNTIRFFDLRMQTVINARVEMEADLRRSLQSHGFTLNYQRQTDNSGHTVGAEALLRWQRPSSQQVSPSVFIPLAEETGLILQLGAWVLEAACRQLVSWDSRPETAHLTMAVNVSARQFRQPAFVDQVLHVIERTGADPRRIKLELTESLLVANIENTIDTMHALKEKGIGFALDDFGTGYSSLAYLKRLPLDQLKIDQSFVRDVLTDPNDAAIARTILGLGHTLGLDVIAEGVETANQRDFLAMHGCRAFQGYLFGRPVTAEQF